MTKKKRKKINQKKENPLLKGAKAKIPPL